MRLTTHAYITDKDRIFHYPEKKNVHSIYIEWGVSVMSYDGNIAITPVLKSVFAKVNGLAKYFDKNYIDFPPDIDIKHKLTPYEASINWQNKEITIFIKNF